MRILIDTERGTLEADGRSLPLSGPEAFRILSAHWLRSGWHLGHYATFSWMGRQLVQLPDDVLRMAEAIWCLRPDVIVEAGVYEGGFTLLAATLCRMMGHGRVVGIEKECRPGVHEALEHCGVTLIEGDSSTVDLGRVLQTGERVFVLLDSNHSRQHVLRELENFAPFVDEHGLIVVADSALEQLSPEWRDESPMLAVEEFLAGHPEFIRDQPAPLFQNGYDFTHISYFAGAWLKRRPVK